MALGAVRNLPQGGTGYNGAAALVPGHIIISPKAAGVSAGNNAIYTAEAFDEYNHSMGDVTTTANFTVQNGAGGNWTGSAYSSQYAGVWTITASYKGKTDAAVLKVNAARATTFVFSPISSPQPARTPFPVTITAVDRFGNTAESFSNTASICTHAGILPDITGAFSEGVWTGMVVIADVCPNDSITATQGGIVGFSNHFDVVSAVPELSRIAITPKTAEVSTGTRISYTAEAFDQFNRTLGNITIASSFTIQNGAAGNWNGNTYSSQNPGVWIVTASYGGKTDNATLTVVPLPPVVLPAGDAPLAEIAPKAPVSNLTIDFLGRITTVPISSDGRILDDVVAKDPQGLQTLEIARGNKVTDASGNVVKTITVRETPPPAQPREFGHYRGGIRSETFRHEIRTGDKDYFVLSSREPASERRLDQVIVLQRTRRVARLENR